MNDTIDYATVIEALRVLGIHDPDDVREVKIDHRDVTVTRYHKPQGRMETDGNGGIVLAERSQRIVNWVVEPEPAVEGVPGQLDRDSTTLSAAGCEPV